MKIASNKLFIEFIIQVVFRITTLLPHLQLVYNRLLQISLNDNEKLFYLLLLFVYSIQ